MFIVFSHGAGVTLRLLLLLTQDHAGVLLNEIQQMVLNNLTASILL